MHILENPIDYLKGVGPSRADLLKKELRIFTYGDLLHHYPFRYIDKCMIYNIAELNYNMPSIQIEGKIKRFIEKGHKQSKRLIAQFEDKTGVIDLVWFKGIRWVKSSLKLEKINGFFSNTVLFVVSTLGNLVLLVLLIFT